MNTHTGEHPKPTFGSNDQQAAHQYDWITTENVLRKVEARLPEGDGKNLLKVSLIPLEVQDRFAPGPPRLPYSPRMKYGLERAGNDPGDKWLFGGLAGIAGGGGAAILYNPEIMGSKGMANPEMFTNRTIGAVAVCAAIGFAYLLAVSPKRDRERTAYQEVYEQLCSSPETLTIPFEGIILEAEGYGNTVIDPGALFEYMVNEVFRKNLPEDETARMIDELLRETDAPLRQISDAFSQNSEVSPPVPPQISTEWEAATLRNVEQITEGYIALLGIHLAAHVAKPITPGRGKS